jgi:hypothetical protein
MLDFIFRKKPTIFLLLAIIVISLIFSMLLNQPLHEGFDSDITSDAIMNNPPLDIVTKASDIIKEKEKTNLQKLSAIRELLKGKYKVLGEIYRKNAAGLLKELSSALSIQPKRDGDGNLFDTNALVGDKRDLANKILSSNDYSAMEKIEKISDMAGKDKAVNNILEEYISAWMRMVKDNIEKLQTTANDTVVPIPSP